MIDTKNNLVILICSYNGSENLWSPLSVTYKKYWLDYHFRIFIGKNNKK
jgi:hypothetical protein